MQETEKWNGISIEGIDKLMSDILEYADKSNRILNQISDLVSETTNYFSCESGDKFRDQFSMLSLGNPTVNKNLLSYDEDLMSVKKNYQARKESGVEILTDGQNNVGSRN